MKENKNRNPKNDDDSRKDFESALSRRNFVSAAAKLALIGALLDLPLGAAWAGDTRQVTAFFDTAISMGDMQAALRSHADSYELTQEQIKALSQVDKRELQVISSLTRLRFSDAQLGKLAEATRRSSDPDQLMKSTTRMELTRVQLDGLDSFSSGEIDAFRSLATKLDRSKSLEIPVSDW